MTPLASLVAEIHALADAAALADDRRVGLGASLRASMHLAQARLLRGYPDRVRRQAEGEGWRLVLREPVDGMADAGHLPAAAAAGLVRSLED